MLDILLWSICERNSHRNYLDYHNYIYIWHENYLTVIIPNKEKQRIQWERGIIVGIILSIDNMWICCVITLKGINLYSDILAFTNQW